MEQSAIDEYARKLALLNEKSIELKRCSDEEIDSFELKLQLYIKSIVNEIRTSIERAHSKFDNELQSIGDNIHDIKKIKENSTKFAKMAHHLKLHARNLFGMLNAEDINGDKDENDVMSDGKNSRVKRVKYDDLNNGSDNASGQEIDIPLSTSSNDSDQDSTLFLDCRI